MTLVVTQAPAREIPLSRPSITEAERAAVARAMESPVLSIGPELAAFETALAGCAGTRHAVGTNSGTSALHLAMMVLGIGPGDEVITTPFSFVASANCVLFVGATPVFADIDPTTLSLDPHAVERKITSRTKAILAVDVFGHPAHWDALRRLADDHKLYLVEDSAESIGACYRGRPAGGLGDIGVFAFYPNKQITTGEGGALLTDHDGWSEAARSLRNQGRGAGSGWLAHQTLGFNYRLSELHSALGRAQLARIDEILQARANVAETYNDLLADVAEVETPSVSPEVDMSWFVYVVKLTRGFSLEKRDRILDYLKSRRIGCSNYFPCIHLEPFYRERLGHQRGDFPIAESISDRSIALPFFSELQDEDIQRVVFHLKQAISESA